MKTLSRIAAIVALLGLVLDPPARAQDNVWVSHGPSGVGFVSGFAFGDAVAYAATPNGVFRSRDGGATWEPGGLQGENVGSIATCPAASVILASVFSADGTTWTLRASSDGGASWSSVSDFAAAGTAAVDPWHPTNVYAAATDGSVWKSVDSGASWSRLASPTGNPPQTIVLDSHAIFVESFDSTDNLYKIFRSSDDGATWSRVSPPILYPSSVAAGNAPGVVYAGGFDGFCRSADSAATWSCAGFPGYPASVVELPAANGAGARILAGVLDGAYFSDDSGRTWQPAEMGSQPPGYFPSFGAARSGSPLLAGTIAGILRSDDRGSSWVSSGFGLRASNAVALALDPQAPSTIWANLAVPGTPRLSLFRSADGGFTWSAAGGADTPVSGGRGLAVDPRDSSRLYIGGRSVYRSDDAGQTWTSSPLPKPGDSVEALIVDPADSDRIWAATDTGLYRSDDGARTFGSTAALAQAVYAVLFDGGKPGTVYAGSFYDIETGFYGYPEGGSIFVSRDGGASFAKNAHDFGDAVTAIAADPFDARILYAGTFGRFERSVDGGTTWLRVDDGAPLPGPVRSLVADPVRLGRIYAATDHGMFRTTDRGQSWQPFGPGLGSLRQSSLAIAPDGHWLHAGTYGGGVFELDLESVYPCTPTAARLCLLGNRYAVDVSAPAGEAPGETFSAHTLNDRAGYFVAGSDGDAAVPAVAIKMLPDGAFGYPGTPFFYSSLTTSAFRIALLDTVTGVRTQFDSRSDSPLCGGTTLLPGSSPWDDAAEGSESRSSGAGDPIRLLSGRFSVTLDARHPRSGAVLHGAAMASSDRFGIFSLPEATGDPELPEVVVEMEEDGGFSLVQAGMTSIAYTLTITDSATGAVRVYESGTPFCGAADPHAFGD